jgi:hypothetical protein
LVALFFECLSWSEFGAWSLISIATVMDHLGVLSVRGIYGEGELQRDLHSVLQIALDLPFSITTILVGILIAIVADHRIYANLETI